MTNAIIERLSRAHVAYGKQEGYDENIAPAATDDELRSLEEMAGFQVPPLVRQLFSTPGALPWFGLSAPGWRFEWHGSPESVLSYQKEFSNAKAEYDWDLPPLIRLSGDEDFLAVLEDGSVVQICGNEGNIEDDAPLGVSTLDALLEKYCTLVEGALVS